MATDPTAQELSADPTLADWRVILGRLRTRFATPDFSTGARFVQRIAEVADELNHHPDVDLRYPHVTISTISHDVGRLTERDRALARAISGLAQELDLVAAPQEVTVVEVALDVLDAPAVEPFWAAVLGRGDARDHQLEDPDGRVVAMWFQQMDEARTGRGRFHLDVNVPHDRAQERVAAALAAGGRLVSDAHAPAWWVLADAEGNEACVCTWQGRDEPASPAASPGA